MIKIELQGDRELIARLGTLNDRIKEAMKSSITALVINLRTKVMSEYLSGPTGEHTLSVQTGNLRRSVKWQVKDEEEGVEGTVSYGADVPYARIHELGGTIHIPEIRPVVAQALHFWWGGREMFLKKVAAHDVEMPARAPLRTAFQASVPTIKAELEKAVRRALTLHG